MHQALVLGDSKKNYAIVSRDKGWGYCTSGDASGCKYKDNLISFQILFSSLLKFDYLGVLS